MINPRSLALSLSVAAVFLAGVGDAEASHVRGAHLSWELIGPSGGGFTVRFHSMQEFEAADVTPLPVNPGDNDPAIIGPVTVVFTGLDINGDLYRIIEYYVDHEYTTPGPFTAYLGLEADSLNCCRFDGLINAPNSNYRIETRVDLAAGANDGSPASSIPPVFTTPRIVQMPTGGEVTINLAPGIADPDDSYECKMAATGSDPASGSEPGASGIPTWATNPGNFSVIDVSLDCKLTWDTTGLTVGNRYAVQVTIIEDPTGPVPPNAPPRASALDFIVEISAATCGDDIVQSPETCDNAAGGCVTGCRPPGSPDGECTCPMCDDDVVDPGEECDGTGGGIFGMCPGVCEEPPSPIACECPACGDNVLSPQDGEECDGTDDAACNDACLPDCSCSMCGDNVAEPPVEQCDGTDDTACPGLCLGDCSCSTCGDDIADPLEECDGTDDGACPGACLPNCSCAVCGDNVAEPPIEQCDGTADAACPGFCQPDCTCPVCGDDTLEGAEQCDGTADAACPGFCQPDCTCPVCGDNATEGAEQCDGTDDALCPGACLPDCTCTVCGDNATEGAEQCDGTDDAACPGFCLPSGDPNQCECPICGDQDVNQLSEQCDGTDDALCPGACLPDCTCSICGDNSAQPPVEQCDGTDDGACPGECLPPGHAFQCRCEFCGDGDINQPGEACDPPTAEVCNNLVDDNNDNLVDCQDPLCSRRCEHNSAVLCSTERDCRSLQAGSNCLDTDPTCGATCEVVNACQLMLSDPARITLAENEPGVLWLHTRFRPQSDVDPLVDGFAILVSNAQGDVYRAELPGSALVKRSRRAYVFRDKTARDGGGVHDNGLHSLKITEGNGDYNFRLRAYAQMSNATVPRMTTHIVLGNDSTSVTVDWTATRKGWRLRSTDLE